MLMFLHTNVENENNICLFDSGVSSSVVNSIHCLQGINHVFNKKNYNYSVENGECVSAQAIGTIKIKFPNGVMVTIDNVAYIESLPHNLMSISDIAANGELGV